jgi:hypothetical protein
MCSGDVALQIVVGSERLRMSAVFHSANKWVDVNVDKVLLEKLLGFVLCLGRTSVPSTFDPAIRLLGFLLTFPAFTGCFGVELQVRPMLLDIIARITRRTSFPFAIKQGRG